MTINKEITPSYTLTPDLFIKEKKIDRKQLNIVANHMPAVIFFAKNFEIAYVELE